MTLNYTKAWAKASRRTNGNSTGVHHEAEDEPELTGYKNVVAQRVKGFVEHPRTKLEAYIKALHWGATQG